MLLVAVSAACWAVVAALSFGFLCLVIESFCDPLEKRIAALEAKLASIIGKPDS
jgi:hypothetical protein